ncbi:MAG: hypothetical protein HY048_18740 [Acidobacteria bacterium]|nr:hypothetical protein [Acidobacteriota bacterium]
MRHLTKLIALAALTVAAASCGTAARDSQSPVYVVINALLAAQGNKPATFFGSLTSDVITNVTTPAPCTAVVPCPTVFNDLGQAVLSLALKNIGAAGSPNAPTLNNAVTITRYHVQYRRADGRNTQGVDVPFAFDGAATGTILPAGTLTLSFELVRITAKKETPLVQLLNNGVVMTTIADVTFYGKDQVGNEVSVTGSIQIDFGNFGDT